MEWRQIIRQLQAWWRGQSLQSRTSAVLTIMCAPAQSDSEWPKWQKELYRCWVDFDEPYSTIRHTFLFSSGAFVIYVLLMMLAADLASRSAPYCI